MAAIDFNFNETCPQEQVHPAGYPEHLFANTVAEGYELIQNGSRKFVFVRQPYDVAAMPSMPPIPNRAGILQGAIINYNAYFYNTSVAKKVSEKMGLTNGFYNNMVYGFYFPHSGEAGYEELAAFVKIKPEIKPKITKVSPEHILESVNAKEFTGESTAYVKAYAESAQSWWQEEDISFHVINIIYGVEISPRTPFWHTDPGNALVNSSFGVNFLSFWYGPRTVYCDATIDTSYKIAAINTQEKLIDNFLHAYAEITDIKVAFNDSHFRDHVRASIQTNIKVNASHTLGDALRDYDENAAQDLLNPMIDMVTQSVDITVRTENLRNSNISDLLASFPSDKFCTDVLRGTLYETPEGYVSMHAIADNPSYAALHRSPLDVGARWGMALLRSVEPTFNLPEY